MMDEKRWFKDFGILLGLTGFFVTSPAHALVTPVGASVFPPIEVPMRSASIVGARLNLFVGIHQSVYGFDLGGGGNITDKDFGGLQLAGLFNRNKGHGSIYGFQIASLVNWNLQGCDIWGLQIAAGMNYNRGKGTIVGLEVGALGNRTDARVVGAQIGLYNQAKDVFGFQIGLINVAKRLHGLQVGLVNLDKEGPLPFFPVVNVGI